MMIIIDFLYILILQLYKKSMINLIHKIKKKLIMKKLLTSNIYSIII